MGHGVGVWKPTPASALLSPLPPGCPLLLQSQSNLFFFEWEGEQTTAREAT